MGSDEGTEHMDAIQAAIHQGKSPETTDGPHLFTQFLSEMPGSNELFLFLTATLTASNLTTMLEGGGSGSIPLMRHVSSVGEHVSSTFQVMPIAKRAETFAGFDTTYDISKGQCVK